mgnify:CR=1 FL=1
MADLVAHSLTMQSAEIAAKAVADDFPVRVVDSRSVSMGQGIIVRACAIAAEVGAGLDELAQRAADPPAPTGDHGDLHPDVQAAHEQICLGRCVEIL